jgi:hypothetical protein
MRRAEVTARSRVGRLHLLAIALLCCSSIIALTAASAGARVRLVGSFEGHKGGYKTIQSAVNASRPGDWVLVGPGDYKEKATTVPTGAMGDDRAGAAVLVTTAGIHIRGMNRNGVMLDGTKAGASQCSPNESDQNFGPVVGGSPSGRNGLVVFKAPGVSVENLSACNFLTGSRAGGDEIWFDGGASSGTQNLGSWRGAYLSATSTYYAGKEAPFAQYGLYASNTYGPGLYTQVYANNQADAAYYIGACPNCNTILDHAHGENSDLGYSGTNSGGHLIVQNSEFNNNQSGFVTNSQNNDDAPSPQDGSCPGKGEKGPTGTSSCWLFTKNSVHDNNNPNVPTTGSAAAGPVGSGVVIAGGRHDTVSGNHIYNNGAWGVLLVPYPDPEEPPAVAHCEGGVGTSKEGKSICYFDDWGNEVANNTLTNNGFFANNANVDLAEISNVENPGNCWHGNTDTSGTVTSEPKAIQSPPHSECGIPDSGESLASPLGAQVACDTGFFAECPKSVVANYPKLEKVKMQPLSAQPSMPEPCLDVPHNAWCPGNVGRQPAYPVPGSPVP